VRGYLSGRSCFSVALVLFQGVPPMHSAPPDLPEEFCGRSPLMGRLFF